MSLNSVAIYGYWRIKLMTIKEFEDTLNCYIENAKQLGNNNSFINGAKRMAKYAVSLANELNKIERSLALF